MRLFASKNYSIIPKTLERRHRRWILFEVKNDFNVVVDSSIFLRNHSFPCFLLLFLFFICNWWPFQNKLRLDFAFFVCTIYIVKQTVVSILLKKKVYVYPERCFFLQRLRLLVDSVFFFFCSVSSAVEMVCTWASGRERVSKRDWTACAERVWSVRNEFDLCRRCACRNETK